MPNPVLLIAPDGKIVDANMAAESFFEIPLIGRFFKPSVDESRDRPRQLPVEPVGAGKPAKAGPPAQSPPAQSGV